MTTTTRSEEMTMNQDRCVLDDRELDTVSGGEPYVFSNNALYVFLPKGTLVMGTTVDNYGSGLPIPYAEWHPGGL
jgi:hypothetical protein